MVDDVAPQFPAPYSLYLVCPVVPLSHAYQCPGLASRPNVAAACAHEGVGTVAERRLVSVHAPVCTEKALQPVAAVVYSYALVFLCGEPPAVVPVSHERPCLHVLRAADVPCRVVCRACLRYAVALGLPQVALPVAEGSRALYRCRTPCGCAGGVGEPVCPCVEAERAVLRQAYDISPAVGLHPAYHLRPYVGAVARLCLHPAELVAVEAVQPVPR